MVHRFKLHYSSIKNHIAWLEHEKGGQFPLNNTFFYKSEEKNQKIMYYHAYILFSFRIDFEISLEYIYVNYHRFKTFNFHR